VVLITGAGKGTGRALAFAFAERGAVVAANDISPVNLEPLVSEILSRGGRAKAYIEDVAKQVGAQTLVNDVTEEFGGVDILVNHAAVEPRAPLLEMDEWDWHRALDVNLTGAFLMMQSAGRAMRGKGWGAILNIVTESGLGAAYRASMAGLRALSQSANSELSPLGIRVRAIENSADVVKVVMSVLEAE
ncbi:MAG: SDR family NAD(P)-dependent oxidoreductase, partial [Chloroflexi bacterium]|nr:SDR family NAD(P)-dependent oxidoreductase [Chloroflexota bacterium]